jgi:ketosteroid isomerase-like protein
MPHPRPGDQSDIDKICGLWADAEREGDVNALASLLHDDFVGVGPRGFLLSNEQWIGRYASGDLVNEAFALEDLDVRQFGDAAIATGTQSQRTAWRGQSTAGRFRITLVLIREDAWSIAHVQLSAIADPPERSH